MKRLIILLFITTTISITTGSFIFIRYKSNIEDVISKETTKVYFILYESFNDINKVNKLEINNYILINENGFYKVYVGCTLNYDNALKIKEIYLSSNTDVFIIEKEIENDLFVSYLKEIDILDNLNNEEILNIENDIINKYNELFSE